MTSEIIYATKGQRLTFDYTNHRGETGTRRVECCGSLPFWGATDWHPEPQWLLDIFDLDRKAWRAFAMKDMSNIRVMEKTDDE
jgi:predicted DNA-binding transcriptional regulator YafY